MTVRLRIKPGEWSGSGGSGMGGNVSVRGRLGKKTWRLKREHSITGEKKHGNLESKTGVVVQGLAC